MARPRTRTSNLPAAEVAEVKRLFGTVTNAYDQVITTRSYAMRERVFQEVASGRPVKPTDLAAFRDALKAWKRANLK